MHRPSVPRILTLCLLTALLAAPWSAACAQSGLQAAAALEEALVKTIAECEPAVVSIARVRRGEGRRAALRVNPFGALDPREDARRNRNDPTSPDFLPSDFGAGVILAPSDQPTQRYILTNYHVVKGGPVLGREGDPPNSRLFVRLATGHSFEAAIKAADPRSDLAVLEIDYANLQLRPQQLKPLKFADNLQIRKGQLVVALGNPYAIARDGSASAAWGMVSNFARRPAPPEEPESFTVPADETLHDTGTLIQVDLKLNLGTSGGALINLRGEFVGLTTSLAAIQGYDTSAGFAIPADARFRRIFETLARGQEVEYGFLGVGPQDVPPEEVVRMQLPIVQPSATRLSMVFQNSPASRAGLRILDVVLSVNGETVLNRRDLMREVSLMKPEAVANLQVLRQEGGRYRQLNVPVKLGKWPVQNDEEIIATSPAFPVWRGLDVDYPTGRYRFIPRLAAYPDAVLVREVEDGSPAAEAGIQAGEFIAAVNGRPTETPAEFFDAVGNTTDAVRVRLRDGRELSISPPSPAGDADSR